MLLTGLCGGCIPAHRACSHLFPSTIRCQPAQLRVGNQSRRIRRLQKRKSVLLQPSFVPANEKPSISHTLSKQVKKRKRKDGRPLSRKANQSASPRCDADTRPAASQVRHRHEFATSHRSLSARYTYVRSRRSRSSSLSKSMAGSACLSPFFIISRYQAP